jgi:acetyl esterase/lipase
VSERSPSPPVPGLGRIALDVLRRGTQHRYADHAAGICELHLPAGPGPHPVAVVIHGGSWSAGYDRRIMRPVCRDLVRRRWAAWNVEYRRMGRGQGDLWPAMFDDVAAAVDALADVDVPVDLDRVVLVGHSAGGHLALWAAARDRLPQGAPGAAPRVTPRAVVGQAPVADLERGTLAAPGGLVHRLLGGGPAALPERYALANPMRQIPLTVPALLVHGAEDRTVTVEQSRSYTAAARAAGGDVELVEPRGAVHRAHVDPRTSAWGAVAERLDALARA